MTVTAAQVAAPKPELAHAVDVGLVAGGSSTNPIFGLSKIGNDDFKAALEGSLRAAGLLGEKASSRYTVEVAIVDLDQPLFGLDMRVTSTIKYTLKDRKNGAVVFDEAIVAPFTARMSDSVIGTKRARLANEGSARKSIATLIEKLNSRTVASPKIAAVR